MIEIVPILAFDDNYIWLLVHEQTKQAIAIDVGDSKPVVAYLQQHDLTLTAIWITHDHHDHVGGVSALLAHFALAKVYCHHRHQLVVDKTRQVLVDEGDVVLAWDCSALVWQSFGHTDSHISFLLNMNNRWHVFCGDTLFSGGCGRVFTGTITQLYQSFCRYQGLPDDSLLYPAHEYTLSNLSFGQAIEPDNTDMADKIIQLKNTPAITLPTTLAEQRKINVFMRTHLPSIKNSTLVQTFVKEHLPDGTTLDEACVFAVLRQLKNNF